MRRGGPARGEHTVEVLTELGYDEHEIEALFADAVVDGPRSNIGRVRYTSSAMLP